MDASDEEVWALACAGDHDSFAVLFRRHRDSVYTQCARRSGSYDLADDLMSMVFLQAWRSRQRVRFVHGSMKPWLLVVASNVTTQQLRSDARYTAMVRRIREAEGENGAAGDAIERRLDAVSLAPLLAAAISGLSQAEQEVVALCDLGEFGYREAAGALGLPVGTVKSRLSRAHAKLRRQLGPVVADALQFDASPVPREAMS